MAVAGDRVQRFVAVRDATYQAPEFRGFPLTLPEVAPDGLPTLPIKEHSLAKLEAVGRFCNAFTRALKRDLTAYIDLYAGPGVLQLDDGKLTWGSPMMALQCADPFNVVVCVEKDAQRCEALVQRSRRVARRSEVVSVINGPAEESLNLVARSVPRGSIAVALVDPFRMEFSLSAVRSLARSLRHMDMILLFAEGMDLVRNLPGILDGTVDGDRYDRFFGGSDWRQEIRRGEPPARSAGRLRDLYLRKLGDVGFTHRGEVREVRNSMRARVYLLMYASRHPLGVQLWNRSTEPRQLPLFG